MDNGIFVYDVALLQYFNPKVLEFEADVLFDLLRIYIIWNEHNFK